MMSFGDRSRRPGHLDLDQAEPLVRQAVEAGVTLFDTADMYDRGASEEVTGALLARLFPHRGDYVDLYQVHRFDPETPVEETMSALDDVVRAGKARYIGASSMYAWQLAT